MDLSSGSGHCLLEHSPLLCSSFLPSLIALALWTSASGWPSRESAEILRVIPEIKDGQCCSRL